jgi:hypothetical protein
MRSLGKFVLLLLRPNSGGGADRIALPESVGANGPGLLSGSDGMDCTAFTAAVKIAGADSDWGYGVLRSLSLEALILFVLSMISGIPMPAGRVSEISALW